jgi:hypothetical protein
MPFHPTSFEKLRLRPVDVRSMEQGIMGQNRDSAGLNGGQVGVEDDLYHQLRLEISTQVVYALVLPSMAISDCGGQ